MRVLLVLGAASGGLARHVDDLAVALAEAGHDVTLAGPEGSLGRLHHGAAVARAVPVRIGERPDPVRDPGVVATLRGLVTTADIVHAHGLRAGALAVLAAARIPAPVVVTLHNAAPGGRLARLVYLGLERVVAVGATVVLGVSRDLVARMRRLGAHDVRLAVVPAASPAAPQRDGDTVRAELGVGASVPLALTLARLAPQKDLDTLLDAVALVTAAGFELVSVVAGDGPDHDRLERRVRAERLPVLLLGARDDVGDLLAAADIVVSSARWEGQPVALQEALHAGCAIVATDAGGTADVVGDAAVLVPVDDPDSLARAMTDVLDNAAVAEDLRARAARRGGSLPTGADALEHVLAAYEDALRR